MHRLYLANDSDSSKKSRVLRGIEARILVVDDREDNALILTRLLAAIGYGDTRIVLDSRETMQTIREFRPDLMFLDLRMPHIDGFEILETVRASDAFVRDLPIIVTSADSSPEIRTKSLRLGADDLFQSFDCAELIDLVAKYVGPVSIKKAA